MVKLSALFAGMVIIFVLAVNQALSIRLDLGKCRKSSETMEDSNMGTCYPHVKVRCRGIKPFTAADCRGTCISIYGITVQLRPVWQSVELRTYRKFRKMFHIPVSCYCPGNELANHAF
ncbi:unnamed protein product [Clavelina lepadiformis]|uniref:Uncharacterized protein n=1 Tax=Clavelina lepadiformis TaxID=159417 RepID=A0ABP0GQ61_CLALP